LNCLQVAPYKFTKLHNFLQIFKTPSANDFRFPHKVDLSGATAPLLSLLLELSLKLGEWKQLQYPISILLEIIV
jgi:hypothetical protein